MFAFAYMEYQVALTNSRAGYLLSVERGAFGGWWSHRRRGIGDSFSSALTTTHSGEIIPAKRVSSIVGEKSLEEKPAYLFVAVSAKVDTVRRHPAWAGSPPPAQGARAPCDLA